ncbi:MAG: VWA domain-containing protein [Methylococcaceae bacterium]|nr:VWA domain-containing protein [Methylococcaceae bacterium]
MKRIFCLIGLLAALSAEAAEYYGQRPADERWPPVEQNGPQPAGNPLTANYYLILDGSGSMQDKDCGGGRSKIDVAKEAVHQFAQRVPPNANLGLYAFDAKGPSERVPLGLDNRDRFAAAVDELKANQNTPLFTAIQYGYRQLSLQGQRQRGYGEYHLVVITDGKATDRDPMAIVGQILRESPVLVETIGFCIKEKHSLNQPGLTFYQAADDPESLHRSLQAVLAEEPDFTPMQFKP